MIKIFKKSQYKKELKRALFKGVIGVSIVTALLLLLVPLSGAQLFQNKTERVVLLLAEEALLNLDQNYPGLASNNRALSSQTLASRIERYASKIQERLERTKTVIIPIPAQATALDISNLVANLTLFEQEQIEGNVSGLVLLGNIPLPEVSDGGREFTSIYPYVDHIVPRFHYDETAGTYTKINDTYTPELWHGIINFSQPEDYAVFFDKTELSETDDFDPEKQLLFYANPQEEMASLNDDLLPMYGSYLSLSEERAYNRYTKKSLQKAKAAYASTLQANRQNSDNPEVQNAYNELTNSLGSDTDAFTPDIYASQQINSYIKPVSALLSGFFNRSIPQLEAMGRYYFSNNEIIFPFTQIGIIDTYRETYFKALNETLKEKVIELAEEAQQKAIVAPGILISGEAIAGNQRVDLSPHILVNHRIKTEVPLNLLVTADNSLNTQLIREALLNGSWINLLYGAGFPIEPQNILTSRTNSVLINRLLQGTLTYFNLGEHHINGTPISNIASIDQCRIHRGSEDGQIVEMIRNYPKFDINDPTADPELACFLPWEAGETKRFIEDQVGCDPFLDSYVLDEHRPQIAEGAKNSQTTHEACFEYRTPKDYINTELKQQPSTDIVPPSDQLIVTIAGGEITMADLILSINPEADLNNHQEWSALLANQIQKSPELIITPNGINRLTREVTLDLNVAALGPTKALDTLIIHEDPTQEFLNQQLADGIAFSLPLDETQWVSFAGSDQKNYHIDVPNLFKNGSFEELTRNLRQLENTFGQLIGRSITGELTGILGANDTWNNDYTKLATADQGVVSELFEWGSSSLDNKYKVILEENLIRTNRFGKFWERDITEITYLNLLFEEGLLKTGFPEVSSNTQVAPVELSTSPSNQANEPDPINITRLAASPACSQYQSTNSAVEFTDYVEYLDCWVENEVEASLQSITEFPNQFGLDFTSENVPRETEVIKEIRIIPEFAQLYEGEETTELPITIELIGQSGNRAVGSAYSVIAQTSSNSSFAGGNQRQELFTVRGFIETSINVDTSNSDSASLSITLDDLTNQAEVPVLSTPNIRIQPDQATAGEPASLRIAYSPTDTRETLPSELTISSEFLEELNDTFPLGGSGELTIGISSPRKAGIYEVVVSSEGRPEIKTNLEITAQAPQQLFLSDRLQPKVAKTETELSLSLFDQYGNTINNAGALQISQLGGTEYATVSTQTSNAQNGVYTVDVEHLDETGVATLEASPENSQNSFTLSFLSTKELTLSEVNNLSPHSLFAQVTHNLSTEDAGSLAASWLKGPYLQTLSLENQSIDTNRASDPFYGTTQTYNQLLKTAAGNSIGLSYLKNSSPTQLTYGDPTYSLDQNFRKNVSQYSSDIGELIAVTNNNITHLKATNDQVALGTTAGEIITLQNQEQPVLLSTLPLGVKELTWWTPKSGQEPILIVTTREQCSEIQGCLFSFSFTENGKLQRAPLKLEFAGKPQSVLAVDLTQDGNQDILLVDGQGRILLFPNIADGSDRVLQKQPIQIANAGQVVDSSSNQVGFFPISLSGGVQVPEDTPQFSIGEQKFVYLDRVSNLSTKSVQISDANGNPLQVGDSLDYNIRLRATSSISNATLALPLGASYRIDESSLDCNGCTLTRSSDRSYRNLLANINVPAGETVTIKFSAIVGTLKNTNPQIQIVLDQPGYPADGKIDLLVVVPGNDFRTIYYSSQNEQGNIIYLPYQEPISGPEVSNSEALDQLRERQNALSDPEKIAEQTAADYQNFTTGDSDGDGLTDSLRTGVSTATDITKDVGDAIENFFCSKGCLALPVNHAFLVAGATTPPLTAVPVFGLAGQPPYVYWGQSAILAGTFFRSYISPTLTGEAAMAICFGAYPIAGCSAFQLFGLHDFGDLCGAINSGIEDLMQGAIDVAQTGIEGVAEESGLAAAGVTVNLNGTGNAPPGVDVKTTVKVPGFPDTLTNWLSAQWLEIVGVVDLPDLTIIYPDFSGAFSFGTKAKAEAETPDVSAPQNPDVLTQAEINEIEDEGLRDVARSLNEVDRLLQSGLIGGQQSIAETEAALNDVGEYFNEVAANSLLKIDEQHFDIQYPYLDPKEIHQFMNELLEWYANTAKEVELTMNSWGCYSDVFANLADTDIYDIETIEQSILDGGTIKAELRRIIEESETPELKQSRQACVELALAWGGLSGTVNANFEILADYLDLPYMIVEIDSFETKVASAVQGYVDEVNEFIVQWLKGNTERIKAWQNTVKTLRDLWGDINFLLSLSLDYTKQCSDCRTDRFSSLAALIDLFINIPDPPVIAMPKLPNITLDFSDVQPGATLTVPTFSFTPVPVELPILPKFLLPKAPPVNLTAQLPEIGFILNARLPAPPKFDDLVALLELPDLPNLKLPKLPLLPLPPDVEQLNFGLMAEVKETLELVSEVLRIVCLVQKAGFPVPESVLKEKVEAITARPLTPVLPIDIASGIGFELPDLPTFRYLKELKVVGHIALNLDADLLIESIDRIVNDINDFSTSFSKDWNQGITDFNNENSSLLDLSHDFEAIEFSFTPEEEQVLRDFNLDFSDRNPQELLDGLEGSRYPRLFAQPVNDQGRQPVPPTTGLQVQTPPGLYIRDEQTGQAAAVMEFTPPALEDIHFDFLDFDKDRDLDLVYSLEKEVFLKRNLGREAATTHLRSQPEFLDYQDLISEITPATSTAINFAKSQQTAVVQTPILNEDQIAVIEVAPSGRTRQATTAKYVVVPDGDLLTDLELETGDLSWQLYTGRDRSVDFGEISVARGSDTKLYVQAATINSELTLPHLDDETTYYISVLDRNNREASNQLFTISRLQCGDSTPPRANGLGSRKHKVIVYEAVELDLSIASDSRGEVVGYYIDTNPEFDTNGDGIKNNDQILKADIDPEVDSNFDGNPANDPDVPNFRLRSYDKPGLHVVTAGLIDQAGNETIVPIEIEVVLPEISLAQSDQNTLQGSISPAKPNIPVHVIRSRDGQYEQIAPTDPSQALMTDSNGKFSVSGLISRETISITDVNSEVVAEIGLKTGAIIHEENMRIRIVPHSYADTTHIEIVDENNQEVTQVAFRPTGLNDVQYWEEEPDLTQNGPLEPDNVYVWDVDDSDNYRWQFLSNDDAGFPGGAVLTKAGERTVIVTPNGDIFAEGPVNFVLEDVDNPFVYQSIIVRDGTTPVARILITVKQVQIIPYSENRQQNGTNGGSFELPGTPQNNQIPFSDLAEDDPDSELIRYLQERYIIEGRIQEGQRVAALDSLMARSEYVKTLLNMMCIEPREGAYREPNVFADIILIPGIPMPWYYPYTKEGYLQGFVTGYEGNIDPVTGLPIFLPDNNISVAEAAKVVLEVLESQEIISLQGITPTDVWYEAYIDIATDLTSVLQQSTASETFILTAQEAADPTRQITRREFFRIVNRVLSFSNCLELDEDEDGLPNYFEQRYNLGDGNDDPDQDRLTNLQEYRLGTNPLDPDTDDGGVDDGKEVFRGTDPLDPSDDLAEDTPQTRGGLVEGYPCVTCPCQYRIEYTSELHGNDEVFAVIKDRENAIIKRSNSVIPRALSR